MFFINRTVTPYDHLASVKFNENAGQVMGPCWHSNLLIQCIAGQDQRPARLRQGLKHDEPAW
jgi:hypothetical protein